MKSFGHKFLASLLLVVLLVSSVFMPVVAAETAVTSNKGPFSIPAKSVVYLNSTRDFYLNDIKADAITKLKSSNKKVATVSLEEIGSSCRIVISGKKAGNSTISFKVKYNKKTYSYKCKVCVRAYASPFKSLKIGSLNLKKYLDSASLSEAINAHVPIKKTLKNKKLSFKLNDGWVLQEAFMLHEGEVRNGQKLTVKKGNEIDFKITDPQGYDLWFYFFFD